MIEPSVPIPPISGTSWSSYIILHGKRIQKNRNLVAGKSHKHGVHTWLSFIWVLIFWFWNMGFHSLLHFFTYEFVTSSSSCCRGRDHHCRKMRPFFLSWISEETSYWYKVDEILNIASKKSCLRSWRQHCFYVLVCCESFTLLSQHNKAKRREHTDQI